MGENPQLFGNLLSEGIRVLAACSHKPISVIEDELGYAIGRQGGSAIGRYRRGYIPPKAEDIEHLAELLVQRGHMHKDWLYSFLESAGYRYIEELTHELMGGISFVTTTLETQKAASSILSPGMAPFLPPLVIGRDKAIGELKARLFPRKNTEGMLQVITAVRGWPGIGKTTLAATLAHDHEVAEVFTDGVLWVSVGPTPDLYGQLITWGLALGNREIVRAKSLEEISSILSAMLRPRSFLLIVDDVWEPEHAQPFMVGGSRCATIVTTRSNNVARAIAPTPEQVYLLPILAEHDALTLFQKLAPTVVAEYPVEARKLLQELEGLPLAIQVAGRMLNTEAQCGFNVTHLLQELQDGIRLLEAQAPADRIELSQETIPSVAVLLQKSTDHLDEKTRSYFALLGVFAPKPATFDMEALKFIWQTDNPQPTVRILVDRGLLEPVPVINRFQMHSLLVKLAHSLFRE